MPLNWYLLNTTGSMTKTNTYVRKYTEGSILSGVIRSAPKALKKRNTSVRISELDSVSIDSTSSPKSKTLSGETKVTKNPQTTKTVSLECRLKESKKEPVEEDSPQMREFFLEVRQRELKDYYLQMKAAETVRKDSCECPHCGLPKLGKTDLSQNIYCTGDKSLKRNMDRNCDRKPGFSCCRTRIFVSPSCFSFNL
ncbi:uncharacterized protein LOC108037801 isoform X1 [Drosophila rhopaloa]|uniref:Uncharacterized protein LOC108037801 isoform X2 n=1 Tax=Drosophila rhopaloa TaxID=1041015 RepID=A0A6P4DWW5_DRORH|nr:uncharacterized protein LOC108037801 isoform X1 [Drosophila rhopaloa]